MTFPLEPQSRAVPPTSNELGRRTEVHSGGTSTDLTQTGGRNLMMETNEFDDRTGHARDVGLADITMSFGDNRVLRGVSFDIIAAEVTALMGANGAGKSTVIKILSGLHPDYTGAVTLDGVAARIESPQAARRLGIETVHQRIGEGIVPGLSVAENLLFERIAQGEVARFASLRSLLPAARSVMGALDLGWSDSFLRTDVFEIGIADQQLLILARALSRRPRLLILDEPTSALSAPETDRLFDVVRGLRDAGVAVLYVSHRLGEIDSLADRLIVLRDGRTQGEQRAPFDWNAAVRGMLGEQVVYEQGTLTERRGDVTVLTLDGVQLFHRSASISMEILGGEVTGFVGLIGAGKSELATGVIGAQPFIDGTMTLAGEPFRPKRPTEAIRHGVYYVPEDRASQAILPGWSIARTTTLPFMSRFAPRGLIAGRNETRAGRAVIEAFGVVATSEQQSVDALSGGNQQKVVVGRWMRETPTVLLLDEPFRGVDIGARRDISHRVRELAADGAAVMVFSSDIDEILEVADRIVVLSEGEIRSDRYTSETGRAQILADMSEVA